MAIIIKLFFKENTVGVELDNGEMLNFTYDVYSQYKLETGMDIQGDLYTELYEESKRIECRNKAFQYLAARSRSVEEMARYLRKKNFSEKHITENLEYLKSKGYLNDSDYAAAFVRERLKSGRHGRDIIVRDLYRRGITRRIIDRAVKECGADEPDMDALYSLALKKFNTVKDKENSLVRVGNYLRQRGFDYDSIKKVLRRLGAEEE